MLDRNSQFSGLHTHRAYPRTGGRNLPTVYRPHGKGSLPSLYLGDGNARRLISRLKWFISTCIVGAIGLVIIGIAMYATSNIEDGSGIVESMQRKLREAMRPKTPNYIEEKAARPGEKTDKIKTTTKGLITRYIIQDSVVEQRDAGEFLKQKPYTRIVASLSTIAPENADEIPAFNPFDIYVDNEQSQSGTVGQTASTSRNEFLTARFMEPTGGILTVEDGLELGDEETERYVAEADAVYAESTAQLRPSIMSSNESYGSESELTLTSLPQSTQENVALNGERTRNVANMTIAEKNIEDDEDNTDEDGELHFVIVKPNESLINIMKTAGADALQAQNIGEIFHKVQGFRLRPGQEVRMRLVPAATDPSQKEPVKISIFSGIKHEATVERNKDGDYNLSDNELAPAKMGTGKENLKIEQATLYQSVYSTMLRQDVDPDTITKFIKVLGYDVDFKQRVRAGDNLELFFESKLEEGGEEKVGELLYISMTVGGEQFKYYRYRTMEGLDFYNEKGSNARKFLLQKPVKAGRFTSGFGYRRHPLLGIRKMHNGVDWAAPVGTPIMAAGNGIIEEAGRHGGNGNYVRIRHSNGYKTTYSHLSKFAPGIVKGVKVKQGDVIGAVGSTGLSTGPHLHYEVLVNNRYTNPQKIRSARSRTLIGPQLQAFKKEVGRLEDLSHRAPYKTRIASGSD